MKHVFFGLLFSFLSSSPVFAITTPDWNQTPGVLCSTSDADFEKLDYSEQVARCNRNVDQDEKQQIAANYGNIPHDQWPSYEFDHLIPLCAGGANVIGNIWPQPLDEAHEKDKVEDEVCLAMRAGTMSQAQAVQKIYDWFRERMAQVTLPK